ncbi:Putative periplasmic protein [Vibrio cholerae]|nr:Putative periplasmic protein [Vibrio cholerae]
MERLFFILLVLLSASVSAGNSLSDLVEAAKERTKHTVIYDGSYIKIVYPNGDVPSSIGVCTDVIIRSYRKLGVDLQVLVHEDMRDNFSLYPSSRIWGLSKPDRNIDHRRVPNLQVFFKRHGQSLPISDEGLAYKAGDIVTWMLPGNLPHIGIVTNDLSQDGKRPLIVHNIGSGPVLEDMLFDFKITGHFRYEP